MKQINGLWNAFMAIVVRCSKALEERVIDKNGYNI